MTSCLLLPPEDLERALRGLGLAEPVALEGLTENVGREEHFRVFTMSHFIVACLDEESIATYGDAMSCTSSQLSLESCKDSDAPCASFCDRDDYEALLGEAVEAALPSYPDLFTRPSSQLEEGESHKWRCPDVQCGIVIRPFGLTADEQTFVQRLAGDTQMLSQQRDGHVGLNRRDPWKFLRYIDALVWEHMRWHLHRHHVHFFFPNPNTPYKDLPGWWWDEDLLSRDPELQRAVQEVEADYNERKRRWALTKTIASAQRNTFLAQARLTRWRRQAMKARKELVTSMFGSKRGVVEVGRALLTLIRSQKEDPRPDSYVQDTVYYKAVEAEGRLEELGHTRAVAM